MEERVSISISEGVADVRLVRADKMNALDQAMFEALVAATERLSKEKGVRVVLPEPTFSVYQQVVNVAGGEIIPAPLNEDLTFNFPRLASKIVTSKAGLTIVCSPNNPTGCVIGAGGLTESGIEGSRAMSAPYVGTRFPPRPSRDR